MAGKVLYAIDLKCYQIRYVLGLAEKIYSDNLNLNSDFFLFLLTLPEFSKD